MSPAVSHVSPFSGSWYPDKPNELRSLLDKLFESSEHRTGHWLAPKATGFVVPHAGLIYSGTVAAAAYRQLGAVEPQRVVLLGFVHRGVSPGLWIPDYDAVETPLGKVWTDREVIGRLLASGEFRSLPESALCDHSVEIQLPLLQHVCPETRLIPIYVSHLTDGMRESAARQLAALVPEGAVVVASSDLTHFGRAFSFQPFPVDEWVGDRLQEMDETVIAGAGSLEPSLFLEALHTTSSTVCGREPISLLLATLKQLDRDEEIFQQTLDYQTSGEITGDFRHSVSYASLGYFPHTAFHLGEEDERLLLESARDTLAQYLSSGRRRPVPPAGMTPGLERRAAAFVTLHSGGRLRGCVGRCAAREPLSKSIPALTLSAALEDNRFSPVAAGETGIDLEISVLTPFKRLADSSSFRVNIHGALLDAGPHRGLLLPQVATERDWGPGQFLDALARKAGATSEVYSNPLTRISVFRAQILH